MAEPMLCASCGPPVPANVLVLHSGLFLIAIPMCSYRQVAGQDPVQVVPLYTPEADDVLATHTLAPGLVVPRRMA